MKNEKNKKKNEKGKNEIKEKIEKIKIIMLGESGVGKTCLINAFITKKFNPVFSTICSSYNSKILQIGNKTYDIHLWDTAGQEKYRSVSKLFIKDSQIVIFVYDITNEATLTELSFWVKYVEELLGKDVVFGVAGNKIDLFDSSDNNKIVTKKEGEVYANEIGAAIFRETSAKEDPEGFISFVEELIKKFELCRKETKNDWEVYSLRKIKKNQKKDSFC